MVRRLCPLRSESAYSCVGTVRSLGRTIQRVGSGATANSVQAHSKLQLANGSAENQLAESAPIARMSIKGVAIHTRDLHLSPLHIRATFAMVQGIHAMITAWADPAGAQGAIHVATRANPVMSAAHTIVVKTAI